MPAELLKSPPDDGHLWIPPDALPGVTILYTRGRNTGESDGTFSYLRRQKRQVATAVRRPLYCASPRLSIASNHPVLPISISKLLN